MIASTSKLAYKQLNEEGIGNTQKSKILYVVRDHYKNSDKGLSLREISKLTNFEINAVSGRVNDLKKDGLLETTDKRKCSYTKRLVSPVIPIESFKKEEISKLKLLLNLYGYKDHKFKIKNNKITFMIGYYKHISTTDLVRLQVNSKSKIVQHSFFDDDCGDKFWYEII